MTDRGTPTFVKHGLGPGFLFTAPLGSTEPADLATAWPAVWLPLGYTDDGSELAYALSTDIVEVAEELDALFTQVTARNISVTFASAEPTARNMQAAMNGGVITNSAGSPFVILEPPDLGTEVRVMLGFQTEDGKRREIYRQCFQRGNITTGRKKGTAKGLIPMEWAVEKPATGERPFRWIQDRTVSGIAAP